MDLFEMYPAYYGMEGGDKVDVITLSIMVNCIGDHEPPRNVYA